MQPDITKNAHRGKFWVNGPFCFCNFSGRYI